MALSELPYADIVEVRNVGRRRANALLAHDWVLLDFKTDQNIQRRDVSDAAGEPQPMWFKIETIQYIIGRPRAIDFTSADLEEEEKRQRREEQEVRRQAGESRVAEKLPEGVEEGVREAVAACRRCGTRDVELRSGICGSCGDDLRTEEAAVAASRTQ